MRFIDECEIEVVAGDGGKGCIAFRREKYVPFGGPSGGDGGRGGNIIFEADPGLTTLYDLYFAAILRADPGGPGQGKDRYGRGGEDRVIRVPLGTVVLDRDTSEHVGDVTEPGQQLLVARGGRGGRGNIHFATPTDRAPRRADPGEPGEQRRLRLELKSMADVGLVGYPNVGKSTLISHVSRARPKVADYPFTTLVPHLGVVVIGETRAGLSKSFVIADIPGLIPGASEGIGLGIRFLRHIERTRVFLHLVNLELDPDRDPVADYQSIRRELAQYDESLLKRPELVVLTKSDLPDVREAYPELARRFAEIGVDLQLISSASHDGLDTLMNRVAALLQTPEGEARAPNPASDDEQD